MVKKNSVGDSEGTAGLPLHGEARNTAEVSSGVEIDGKVHEPGDTLIIAGTQATVIGFKFLPTSSTSGVADGEYPVVSVKQGQGRAFRAVVDGALYPIRNHGKPGEVIAKQRESGKPRKSRKHFTPVEHAVDEEAAELSDEAHDVLDSYLALKRDHDRGEVLSDLVMKHLKSEVQKLKATQEAISKLPMDLLALLAGSSEEKRQQVLAMLK